MQKFNLYFWLWLTLVYLFGYHIEHLSFVLFIIVDTATYIGDFQWDNIFSTGG